MKTYDDYYDIFHKESWRRTSQSELTCGRKWWRDNRKDDFINDMPITENKSKVKNSEWVILHHSIVQLIIDYITEHPLKNEVYSYSLEIDFETGLFKNYLNDVIDDNCQLPDSDVDYKVLTVYGIDDHSISESYDQLNTEIFNYVKTFIKKHKGDLDKMTKMFFCIDEMYDSLKIGSWSPGSDSSMSFYTNDDELYVCSI
jgi:hypothetical protein